MNYSCVTMTDEIPDADICVGDNFLPEYCLGLRGVKFRLKYGDVIVYALNAAGEDEIRSFIKSSEWEDTSHLKASDAVWSANVAAIIPEENGEITGILEWNDTVKKTKEHLKTIIAETEDDAREYREAKRAVRELSKQKKEAEKEKKDHVKRQNEGRKASEAYAKMMDGVISRDELRIKSIADGIKTAKHDVLVLGARYEMNRKAKSDARALKPFDVFEQAVCRVNDLSGMFRTLHIEANEQILSVLSGHPECAIEKSSVSPKRAEPKAEAEGYLCAKLNLKHKDIEFNGVNILGPDINLSYMSSILEPETGNKLYCYRIRMGFDNILGMKPQYRPIMEKIISERNEPFRTVKDFLARTADEKTIPAELFRILVEAGCFDGLCQDRNGLIRTYPEQIFARQIEGIKELTKSRDNISCERMSKARLGFVPKRNNIDRIISVAGILMEYARDNDCYILKILGDEGTVTVLASYKRYKYVLSKILHETVDVTGYISGNVIIAENITQQGVTKNLLIPHISEEEAGAMKEIYTGKGNNRVTILSWDKNGETKHGMAFYRFTDEQISECRKIGVRFQDPDLLYC